MIYVPRVLSVTKALTEDSLRNRASALADAGLFVFPVKPDKSPACPRGFYDATRDTATIDNWWKRDDYGVGVCPWRSSLVVVDLDVRNGVDGIKTFSDFYLDPWSHPHKITTPSGGLHLWYRTDYPVQTKTNWLRGVDIRGVNGYTIISQPDGSYSPNDWEVHHKHWRPLPDNLRLPNANQYSRVEANREKALQHMIGLTNPAGPETEHYRDLISSTMEKMQTGNRHNVTKHLLSIVVYDASSVPIDLQELINHMSRLFSQAHQCPPEVHLPEFEKLMIWILSQDATRDDETGPFE